MTEMKTPKPKKIIALSLLALIIIALVLGIVLALTNLSIEPDLAIERVTPYPYSVKYALEITPDEAIHIGSVYLKVSPEKDEKISVITNEDVSIMSPGESKEIRERRAQISLFGTPIFETNYRVNVTYQDLIPRSTSMHANSVVFDATIETSEQIPEFILSRVMPISVSINSIDSAVPVP